MVVGHYGCGGVRAALERNKLGLVDNWLRHVQDVRAAHRDLVDSVPDAEGQIDRLCELNALEQAVNVCETTVVLDAWARGQPLAVHAWCYGLEDGRLRDLGFAVNDPTKIRSTFESALADVAARPAGTARHP
jgi:carbonic anhydrase